MTIHVQDSAGNPLAYIPVSTSNPTQNPLTAGTLSGYGYSHYHPHGTDAAGNLSMWLFPTTSQAYTVYATPPANSPFIAFSVQNVSFTSDTSQTIILQFAHATPITTATTDPQPNSQGIYPGPVTVTLSATATSGFTIANTYYQIDNDPQQTYSAPFPVTGEGTHTVKYWSVDNAGVYELTKIADDHHRVPGDYHAIATEERSGRPIL